MNKTLTTKEQAEVIRFTRVNAELTPLIEEVNRAIELRWDGTALDIEFKRGVSGPTFEALIAYCKQAGWSASKVAITKQDQCDGPYSVYALRLQ